VRPADFVPRHGAVTATLKGVLDRLRRAPPSLADSEERLDGRTILVTGANRGLGLAIAGALAERGARVQAACRSGLDGLGRLGANVEARRLDLAAFASVEEFTEGLARDGIVLDAAIFNAGVVAREARATGDGLDETFQVNFLSNALLARRLLERGVVRAGASPAPRLVFVSSELHRSAPAIDFADLGGPRSWGMRRAVAEYGASKLLVETWAEELARRAPGVEVHTICPGAVNTDLAREAPRWAQPALAVVMRAFFQDPAKAARPVVFLAASPSIAGETGIYSHAGRRKTRSPLAQDRAAGAKLWRESERLLAQAGHALAPLGEDAR
jgi:NAD(P)-dependent dehydrogenase (short-subunit alcohol dehydrogenase family)